MLAGGTCPNKTNLVTQQNIFHAIRTTNGSCVALQVIETPGWIGKIGAMRCQTPEKMDQGSKLFLPPKAYQSFFAGKTVHLLDTLKVVSLDLSTNNEIEELVRCYKIYITISSSKIVYTYISAVFTCPHLIRP